MYFQPIKNEDPQLDFYTIYKREATEYDAEYMKKYNEDLNTTLIFVRVLMFSGLPCSADHIPRLACSLLSAPPSSSMSSPSLNRIPGNGRKLTSARSFSASTGPSLLTNILWLLPHGAVLRKRLLQPQTFCMQAF